MGCKPALSRIEALQGMTRPTNRAEVRSLLGMAQYSSQFIPNFSELTAPLRELNKDSVQWKWGKDQEEVFKKLQTCLTQESVLGYYEVGLPTKLMVDAGPSGLGLILFQSKKKGWQPVVCASRSLTEVEKRYSQLEKEALAIRWGCERCYDYLIGSPKFVVVTDHQPLIPIFNNVNSRPPLRIERWIMYLQQFDFKLVYSPGETNGADYLSRHSLPVTSKDIEKSQKQNEVVKRLVASKIPKAMSLEQVKSATAEDETLSKLKKIITEGEVTNLKRDPDLQKFVHVFSDLSVCDDLVLRGECIVIPEKLQDQILDICHEGHQGLVKCKKLLRSKVWFPGIDKAMKKKTDDCIPCRATAVQRNERNPLQMSPLPNGPWINVSADHCGPFPTGELVLVVIDEYSRFPEVEIVNSTTAKETIRAMEKMFAEHGTPESMKTDNGPPFQSLEFKEFCAEKGFNHHRVTPLWPEGNGQVENFMRNIKKIASIAHCTGKDWRRELFIFLGAYRATPHVVTGISPHRMMTSRDPRTKLPQIPVDTPDLHKTVLKRHEDAKMKQKMYAEQQRNIRPHTLKCGDLVLVKQKKMNKLSTPYDPIPYIVEKVKGSMIVAERSSGKRKSITRNSSEFRKLKTDLSRIKAKEPVEIEVPEEIEDEPIQLRT